MIPEKLKKIGFLIKPHGIDGTMTMRLFGDAETKIEKRESLFVSIDRTNVPFFIEHIRFTGDIAYVKFAEVNSESETFMIKGKYVFIPSDTDDSGVDLEFLAGFLFVDETSGKKGEITGFSDNPVNPLIQVTSGETEYMIPFNDDLIVWIDLQKKMIRMKLPFGIFDMDN